MFTNSVRRWLIGATVVVITVIAAALRFIHLSTNPGGLYPDEAAEGITGHRILYETGYHPIFVPEDGGREAMFGYFVSFGFRLFGESILTLRSVSAFIGILSVLAIGLALRRFGNAVALTGMAWAAGSLWLVVVSRDGMRNITVPLFGALAFAALLRWEQKPSRLTAALSGIFVAAGLWTYQPLKAMPILVLLWLWLLRRQQRERYQAMARHLKPALVFFFVVATPMLWVAITNPTSYFGRGAATSVFNVGNTNESFWVHTARTLGQFVFFGDPNGRQDVSQIPLLNIVLFAAFIVGLVLFWQRRKQASHLLFLLGLPIFLLPPLLAPEGGSPHFLRNLGLFPIVGALVATGVVETVASVGRRFGEWPKRSFALVTAGVLAATALATGYAYLGRGITALYEPFTYDLYEIAQITNQGPGAVAILDDYSALDVQFMDAFNPPTVVRPKTLIAHPLIYSIIVARSPSDIAGVAGTEIASHAVVARTNPQGQPTVYVVFPH